ncbi:RNA ligase [Acinetobacter phage vB_AbaM_P1]|nr:RNA ligase [Acinetobacter phage vB_AbaM_P1]
MKFIKYTSIKRLTERAIHDTLDALTKQGIQKDFMVTEKIHGANMSIYCDGTEFKVASREGFVKDGIKFYNGRAVADKYKKGVFANAIETMGEARAYGLEGKIYSIYVGELFGGSIHKGTPYPQEQDFILFDYYLVFENTQVNKDILMEYGAASVNEVDDVLVCRMANKNVSLTDISEAIGCRRLEPLYVGSFEGAVEVANDFKSQYVCDKTVKASGVESHGQEAVDYLCITEGVIIEPVEPVDIFGNNLMFKSKNSKFEEKYNTGYKEKISAREKAINTLTEDQSEFLYELDQYITPHRYESVVSKIGEVTVKDFSKVLKDFVDDVLKDIREEYKDEGWTFPELTKEIMMLFTNEVKEFIRPKLLENK